MIRSLTSWAKDEEEKVFASMHRIYSVMCLPRSVAVVDCSGSGKVGLLDSSI